MRVFWYLPSYLYTWILIHALNQTAPLTVGVARRLAVQNSCCEGVKVEGKVDPRNQGTVMIDALLRRCHELVHNDTVIVRDLGPSLNVPGAHLATELSVNGTTLPLCPIGVVTKK